ncbi:putative class V chitinase [Aspergillus floccosus]
MNGKSSLLFILLVLWCHQCIGQDYTCSADRPCELGCCSNTGVCGLGPKFCGDSCISNCDRKSDCNPGWGMEWSQADKCPLNVCCSEYGFCGTTEDFCGNKTVESPTCSGSSASKRTIGYYESWGISRKCDKMYPESLPIGSYTHLNFAFAFIDPTSFKVAPMDEADVSLYKRFTGLKNLYPDLETWISIGGWSMNDPDQPTATTFSDLAASESAQSKFFDSLLSFMETYGFDGVDIDWEYPVAEERSGRAADFDNYTSFLRNLRNALGSTGHKYGLTITIPSSYWYLQHFDIVEIEKTIDWFNLMSYDLHGTWDSTNRYLGPYVNAHTNLTEIDEALQLLWRNSIDPDHVVLGLGFYGRSFTLADPSCNTPGCVFTSGGNAGSCTGSVGTLSYAEIKQVIAGGADVALDKTDAVKMVTWGANQWVSYDDEETLKLKLDYANEHCLGGAMVWAVSTDDAEGTASAALGKLTGRSVLALSQKSRSSSNQVQSCRIGECGKSCPNGLSPAQRSDGKNKGNTGTNTGCSGGESRLYCCPPDNMPTCQWRGGAPFCNGKCHSGEVEVSSSLSGTGSTCWTGHKVLCCTQNAANEAVSECGWTGSAPFCASTFRGKAGCPSGRERLTYSNWGAGGEEPCALGFKSFCCDQPPPYENCDWYYHGGKILGSIPLICTGECPAGKASIATDPSGCMTGYGSYCCDSPATTNDPLVSAFKTQLAKYSQNAVCSKGQRQYSKREHPEHALLKRHDLSKEDWTSLLLQITALAIGTSQTYQMSLMETEYNSSYADEFGLSLGEIAQFQSQWPNAEPISRTESLMCMGHGASDVVSDAERRGILHEGLLFVNNGTKLLASRNLAEDAEAYPSSDNNPEPSWGYMVQGIINGDLTLEYEQLIYTNGGEQILEIVWQLPSNSPGYQEIEQDNYVVFHFHFEHLINDNGVWRPGIYAIVAFHGQQYQDRPRGRVDGNNNDGDNRRAHILNCNTGNQATAETYYWYPGAEEEVDSLEGETVQRFGNFLFQQDLITVDTFTSAQRGQLGTVPGDDPDCPGRWYFEWNGYSYSRQFLPSGPIQDTRGQNDQTDQDDV